MSISETPKEGFELRLDNNGVIEEIEFELLVVLGRLEASGYYCLFSIIGFLTQEFGLELDNLFTIKVSKTK